MTTATRVLFVAALIAIWGSTWLVIKFAIADVPPLLAAGVRFAVAAVILAALSAIQGIAPPRGRRLHLGLLALGGLGFGVSYGVVYWGEQYIPSGLSAVLFATYPLWVLLLAHLAVAGERVRPGRLVGVAIGFLGVALIFRSDLALAHPRAAIGAAVTLVSPLASALGSVGVKRWGRDVHPYVLTTLPMTYGAVALLAVSWAFEPWDEARWTAGAVASTLYLAVFGSVVAFVTYYRVLREVAVSSLALITYVFPVVAVGLGWLVLGERLGLEALAGAAVVLIGIAIASRRRRPPAGAPEGALGKGSAPASGSTPASRPGSDPRPT